MAGVAAAVWAVPIARTGYYRYRAANALKLRQNESALEWLQQGQRIDGNDLETHLLLARTLRRMSRFADMEQHLEHAARLGISPGRVERERWLALAQVGRIDEPQLRQMLEKPGDDGQEICAALVDGYVGRLDLTSADVVLDGWIANFVDDPEPYFRRGELRSGQGEWAEAAEMYRLCVNRSPQRTDVRLKLAQSLLRLKRPEEAASQFRRCLRDIPLSIEARVGLGTCLIETGAQAEARNLLEQVVAEAPRDFAARQQLGELDLSLGHPERAMDWVKPLVELWPDDKRLCNLMARALQEAQKNDAAAQFWERIGRAEEALLRVDGLLDEIREDPTQPGPRYELGVLLLKHTSREDGVGWLQSALRLAPRHAGAHRALAAYYAECGDEELARQHRQLADAAKKGGP
jgi:tetratricopeptide (TPR) repeat protein